MPRDLPASGAAADWRQDPKAQELSDTGTCGGTYGAAKLANISAQRESETNFNTLCGKTCPSCIGLRRFISFAIDIHRSDGELSPDPGDPGAHRGERKQKPK